MKPMRIERPLAAVVLALAAAGAVVSPPARADDQALARKVEALTQRVRVLEQTVKQLQSTCAAATASANSTANVAPAAAAPRSEARRQAARSSDGQIHSEPGDIKEQWRKLRHDMNGGQVASLLGQPSRKFTLNGKTVWYYDYHGVGVGSVMFGHDKHVMDWQRPPLGWLW
jgi:hypothetical protein